MKSTPMHKLLYRSRTNKMIAGVAGGLAEYFDIDPVLVRVLFVVGAFWGGFSILLYVILWIIVPYTPFWVEKEYEGTAPDTTSETTSAEYAPYSPPSIAELEERSRRRRFTAGAILIIVGLIWFLSNILPQFEFRFVMPVLIILIGLLILLLKPKNNNSY